MSIYRTQNRVFLAKLEATSGTEETPTVGSDAIKLENAQWQAEFENIETNEHTASLDPDADITGGGFGRITGDVYLKGSGAAGTAPEYDSLLQAAAMAVTTLATAESGTAQAGDDDSITLASDASGVAVGMVIATTSGTGSGQTRVITAYNSTSKVATVFPDWATTPSSDTGYEVHACALYIPASTSLKTATAFLYDLPTSGTDAILRKLKGAVADASFSVPVRQPGRFSFTLQGQVPAVPDEATAPSAPTFDDVRPKAVLGIDGYLGASAVKFSALDISLGNAIALADDPAETFGYDVAGVVRRRITGTINPRITDLDTRHAFADWIGETTRTLWIRYGDTAGNRISIYVPEVKYTGAQPADVNGFVAEQAPFRAVGADTGVYLCIH